MNDQPTVQQLLDVLDEYAPFSLAAEWDNCGVQIGNPAQAISGIHLALDPSDAVVDEAGKAGANTIITHHPFFFHPLKQIRTDTAQGKLIVRLVAGEMTLIACHTNLDVVPHGVSAVLAERLGLEQCRPLQPLPGRPDCGFGQVGQLLSPMPGREFIAMTAKALAQPDLLVAGVIPEQVEHVAVCGGSGSDLARAAREQGARIFVSAEIKHSVARWAEESGICLVDAGHFSTEQPMMAVLARHLGDHFGSIVTCSSRQQRPLAGLFS